MEKIRIVHYINQFFAQYGGETEASMDIVVKDGAVGPGLGFAAEFGEEAEVVATIVCGDNAFVEKLEEKTAQVLSIIESYKPDLVVAGPAFAAGRYGVACGAVCAAVNTKLGIPAITGMYEENPGVDAYKAEVYIIKTGNDARHMAADIKNMAAFAKKLLNKEEIGRPEDEGYFYRGRARLGRTGVLSVTRAINMLLDKYYGRPFETEIPLPKHDKVEKPAPVPDLSQATVVMITDGGLYPLGNPDKMPLSCATRFVPYSVEGSEALKEGEWEVRHSGYDNNFILADPNRLVPLDAMRTLEKEHVIGKVHDEFLSTTGLVTSLPNSIKIGKGMVEYIKSHNIDAAILTST